MASSLRLPAPLATLLLLVLCTLVPPIHAIKFSLQTFRFPPSKCIWNTAHNNALVIVTANVGPGDNQRVDIEIIDSSPEKRVYLSKRDIKGETRLAVTTHADGEVGVCFKNYLHKGPWRGVATRLACRVGWVGLNSLFAPGRHIV